MTLDMNSTVINGTPRHNSMKAIENILTTGIFERRPRASRMPIGNDATMPVTATTSVTRRPPHCAVSTGSSPKSISSSNIAAMSPLATTAQLLNADRPEPEGSASATLIETRPARTASNVDRKRQNADHRKSERNLRTIEDKSGKPQGERATGKHDPSRFLCRPSSIPNAAIGR